jgi:PIN domain nuclease of toxin-antitoxin system
VDVDADGKGVAVHAAAPAPPAQGPLILLDTNALIWLWRGHRRVRPLATAGRLFASPASILELQMLAESGRVALRREVTAAAALVDERWVIDEVPSTRWLSAAANVSWTRDPFDRLIVAHARVRGWKLATADRTVLAQLPSSEKIEL